MNTPKFKVVEHAKTTFNKEGFAHKLQRNNEAKLIGFEFGEDGHPINGVAYWKFVCLKFAGKLYIIENHPHDNDDDYDVITKEIQY